MSGINPGRWLAGGLAAGILMWFTEGAATALYAEQMRSSLAALGRSMEMSPTHFAVTVFASLVSGLVLVFLYAAARPRFGPGPMTAILMAFVMWSGGYLFSLCGYYLMGLFPTSMLVMWGFIGLIEMVLASLLGAWIYRESAAAV